MVQAIEWATGTVLTVTGLLATADACWDMVDRFRTRTIPAIRGAEKHIAPSVGIKYRHNPYKGHKVEGNESLV